VRRLIGSRYPELSHFNRYRNNQRVGLLAVE
jgi:hypothetical protein